MLINAAMPMQAARAELAAHYDLSWSEGLAKETAHIYEKLRPVMPEIEWPAHAPYIRAINELKKKKNAVILAHNYMTPEIFFGVSDIAGDSLQLAIAATKVDAPVIVQCGVHFMAETSKILNPQKTILIPDSRAGCSLASSIRADDIEAMRKLHPGAPVVSYVNTTAETKAASDYCCTSANAVDIVNAMESDVVIMTPDGYLAQNVAAKTNKKIVYWSGSCIVHERFTAPEIRAFREANPGVTVIAHPECPPEVVREADFAGSTSGMIDWVQEHKPEKVVMITECSMSDNVAASNPQTQFIRPCSLCPHMKRITLEKILWCLHTGQEEVTVPEEIIPRARLPIERMIAISNEIAARRAAAALA
ncbi:quinolinate synthase NadA [Neomegalonema perideroedes]|uniref:quinolinate synthase NadA n=1 Tax=Neomegalonema perideroedes TaxID=217219 RepID=UPI0003698E4F|nr:quinolinate synthase NadA [Neomegalonema perideroedes]